MQRSNSSARRAVNLVALLAVAIAALTGSAAQAHDPSLELRAHGTAVVDGIESPGEWDRAARWNFTAAAPGGPTAATLYAMNDGVNLYLGVRHARPELDGAINLAFDNNHNGSGYEEGDDVLILNRFGFYDMFVSRQPPCDPGYTCIGIEDTEVGGTSEGSGVLGRTGTHAFFELSHPLDTADNGHDFSLRYGKRAGFRLFVLACDADECGTTYSPPGGDVVIVSDSTVAPETQIAGGPTEGSFTREGSFELEFSGTDDVIAAEDLRFECSENNGEFDACESPYEYMPESQGPQSFQVRAIDEVGKVDATPAARQWTFDTLAPRAISIRGPRRFTRPRVVFRLAAVDNVDRTDQLRFRCSLDRGRLRPCSARHVLRVKRGRHVLRVIAIDRTGNVSTRAQARFVRLRA